MAISPSDIIARIPKLFDKALSQGDLLFFPSTINVQRDDELKIEVSVFGVIQNSNRTPSMHRMP